MTLPALLVARTEPHSLLGRRAGPGGLRVLAYIVPDSYNPDGPVSVSVVVSPTSLRNMVTNGIDQSPLMNK